MDDFFNFPPGEPGRSLTLPDRMGGNFPLFSRLDEDDERGCPGVSPLAELEVNGFGVAVSGVSGIP